MPDVRLGEVGIAFVVPARDSELDPDALVEWARGTMANYKVPRAVEVVESLPVNAAGKVEKEVLRARAADRQA
jgi:acyl-CoA synthetase (AMP-forming)/AMP-acid ligase II